MARYISSVRGRLLPASRSRPEEPAKLSPGSRARSRGAPSVYRGGGGGGGGEAIITRSAIALRARVTIVIAPPWRVKRVEEVGRG